MFPLCEVLASQKPNKSFFGVSAAFVKHYLFLNTHWWWPAPPSLLCSHTDTLSGSALFHGDRGSYFLLWSSPLPRLCDPERASMSSLCLSSRCMAGWFSEAWNRLLGPRDSQTRRRPPLDRNWDKHSTGGWTGRTCEDGRYEGERRRHRRRFHSIGGFLAQPRTRPNV